MKTLLYILGGLLALGAITALVMTLFLGSIVTKGVNTVGPKVTGTAVSLDDASVSLLNGSATLKGLSVGNPAGWKSDRAFYLGQVHLDLQPTSLLGDHIVIDEILIDQPEFVYETKIITSNLKELLAGIEKATGGSAPSGTSKDGANGGQPVKFAVKKFRLQNAKVTLGVGPAAITVPMPPLSLDDLGTKEGGITADQLATKVMTAVLADVVQATAQAAGKIGSASGAAATDALRGATQKAGEGLKKLFGGDGKP